MKSYIEALLFATPEPLTQSQINGIFPGEDVDLTLIVDELNTQNWVDNFKKLTGIETLVASNSKLANYHEMEPGGYLGPHVDHSSEPISGMPHVLNIILFLSDKVKKNLN